LNLSERVTKLFSALVRKGTGLSTGGGRTPTDPADQFRRLRRSPTTAAVSGPCVLDTVDTSSESKSVPGREILVPAT